MNWRHLQTFAWLRWRLMKNMWSRAGRLNAILLSIVAVASVVTAVPLLIGSTALGIYLIPKAEPIQLLYVWDGLIVALLFFWMLGLITDLQRTEPLSLSKFLHLPVSVGEAFLINYLSSLVRLSLIFFGPIMLGYALALVYVKGASMLIVLPLLAAFLLMLTALTYQFQGWLASMMNDPRRRRTVVVVTTMAFVLFFQLPNMLNFYMPWNGQQSLDQANQYVKDDKDLTQALRSGKIQHEEYARRRHQLSDEFMEGRKKAERERSATLERTAKIANMALPIGWLPLGVMSAAEGNFAPALLGLAGLTAIGAFSLRRAYRTTLRLYRGETSGRRKAHNIKAGGVGASAAISTLPSSSPGRSMLEAHLPGVSEPVSAVALGNLRSLLRSPEAKMMLLMPTIMIPVCGSMAFRGNLDYPELVRPLFAIGGMIMVLFGLLQMMGNQFGFDRDGFRVFILCAAPRRDILLGKNLSFVPIVLVMTAIVLSVIQFMAPMRWDHLVATIPQYISMYLLFCILSNALSIFAPVYIAAGTMKPTNIKLSTILLQFLMFAIAFPLTQAVVLIPLGAEVMLRLLGWSPRVPVYLVLSLVECGVVMAIYFVSLRRLGDLLQSREQIILDSVTSRPAGG